MERMRPTLLIFGIMLAAASGCEDARGSDLATPEIERCRAIVNDTERLSCYDNIGSSAPSANSEEPEDREKTEIAEDFGLPDTDKESRIYSVAMDRCGMAPNRFFYFYFENGQVWKYVGNKKLRYKSCPTSADINEDRYGYKLRLQGETRWHRIQRMK